MIKNRESAARSRARKQVWKLSSSMLIGILKDSVCMNIACFLQAYTVELETEVTLLKEENAKLKQQQVGLILQQDLNFYLII